LQVKLSRTSTDQRSFCQRAVLYQRLHSCVVSRKRLRCCSSPAWVRMRGGILPTMGRRVLSLAMRHSIRHNAGDFATLDQLTLDVARTYGTQLRLCIIPIDGLDVEGSCSAFVGVVYEEGGEVRH